MQTKLFIPASRARLVIRQRLIDHLNEGLLGKLTLVSTPAGFGKTTLIANWGSQLTQDQMCWLSLDEQDNDSMRFLAYLVAAMKTAVSNFGQSLQVVLQSPQAPSRKAIWGLLANEFAQLERDIVLVLDDFHLIQNEAIHQTVEFLLNQELPRLHVVLATRVDPPLPLARFRARGQMTELRAADLRFAPDEITPFLNEIMALSLSDRQIETLASRTEGWAAGLQMAALSIKGKIHIDEFIADFGGSHRFVLDYLTEEVVHGLPNDWQQFILQTVLLNRLSGPLCTAVTGQSNSQQILETLEENNLFLTPLDDERIWFRYHHLFADVMRHRLQRTMPDDIPNLHIRAAKWFGQNDFHDEAIDHALAANEYQLAAEIINEQALAMLMMGNLSTLQSWLNRLPEQIVQKKARLILYRIWTVLLSTQNVQRLSPQIDLVEEIAVQRGDIDELRGDVAAVRAYLALRLGDLETAVSEAEKAIEWLHPNNYPVKSVMAFVLGWVYEMQQNIPQAIIAMQDAFQLAERAGNLNTAVSALCAIGDLQLRQGDVLQSERTFNEAMQMGTGRNGKLMPIAAPAHAGLAKIRLAQGDFENGRFFATNGLDLAEQWDNADSRISNSLLLAQIEHEAGNHKQAFAALEKARQVISTQQPMPTLAAWFEACEVQIFASPTSQSAQSELVEPLTEREIEVLQQIAAGLSNQAISDKLIIALGTVKAHTASIYGKLGVRSRTQAVARAQELHLI